MVKIINFTDVNPINNLQKSAIRQEIYKTIKKKDFILGENVKKFEKNFSKISKIKYTVGCASGTDSLILAIKRGISEGTSWRSESIVMTISPVAYLNPSERASALP